MKIRIKNTILVFIFMMIINSIGFATVYHPPFPNGELVFSVDEFPLEYASSYILINNSHKSSSSKLTDDGTYIGAKELSAKNTSAYVDHYNSAWMNGVPYDIREYPYACDTSGCIKITTGAMHRKVIGGKIYREFHFYESGHCGEPEYEVEFKGIIKVRDVDEKEIFGIYGGALVNCYLADGTVVTTRSDGHSWTGTIDASDPSTGDDFDTTPRAAVWATVHSTPSNPMILYYKSSSGTANGISINLVGCNINYNIVSNGTEELPISGWTSMVVEYGKYKINQRKNVEGYSFSGWYWDSALTNKVDEDEELTITSDKTVYGTYRTSTSQYIDKVTLDVTGAVTDTGTSGGHVCTANAVQKFDGTYHWQECSICSAKYVKAGRPNDSSWTNSYLEIKQNTSGQRILVIKNSRVNHSYTSDYWTYGDASACSDGNVHIYSCICGYSYSNTIGRANHDLRPVGSAGSNSYRHSRRCRNCNVEYYREQCYDAGGTFSCQRTGTCLVCNASCVPHHTNGYTGSNNTVQFKCYMCNTVLANVTSVSFTHPSDYQLKITWDFLVPVNSVTSYDYFTDSPQFFQNYSQDRTMNGNVMTVTSHFNLSSGIYTPALFSQRFEVAYSDGRNGWVEYFYNKIKPETTAPTININQSNVESVNGWTTNSRISVSGVEGYCSSVNIVLKDTTTSTIIYSTNTSVTNNNYSIEIVPDVAVGSTPKQYIIEVSDTLENKSSNSFTIQGYDRIPPNIVKTGQTYTYQGENAYSTSIPWSKSKDFSISAIDEGTDIASIEIQNVTSTKTGVVFEDDFGVTTIDESTSPKKYTRQYGFTGDVKGYITLLASAKDYANNETNDYFRVYNLDNTSPYISGTPVADAVNKKFTATIADAGSGIKYFGLVPYLGGDVVYPATYETSATTMAIDRNKWYPVSLISANATTGEPEHGPSSVNVELKVTDGGTYAIVIEDYVGNRYSQQVSIEGIDNTPPTGAISVRDAVTLYTDKEAVNTKNVMLDIVGQDNNSGIDKMAIINQEDIPTSNLANLWETFATEKAWTLTDGDGEKVIYLILSDRSCNITAVPAGLRNQIIVTLNPQGGTGGTASVTVNFAQAMPSATMPTKTGHSFKGYFDTSEATGGNQYYTDAGASARNWDKLSNETIYARWTANTYTVTLNQKSGSGGTSSVTATYGSAMPTATMPTRTGYTFQGYYDVDATTGGNQYYTSAGASARNWDKTANTTLYARWTPNTNTVTLNQNNGSGGTTSVTATYAQAMPSATMPTRAGYDFQGYYDTNAATGGNQYYTSAGASARNWDKTANTTLYARWNYVSTPVITRSDYNTFTVSATGASKYLISKTQTTAPTSSTSGWATTTNKDASTSSKETWYVWAEDADGRVSSNYATITNYKVTLTAGSGTTLTAKADSTSGTTVTSGMYVLNETPVYPTGALQSGYKSLVLEKDSTTITNGSSQIISSDTTFTTSATKITITLTYDTKGGYVTTTANTIASQTTTTGSLTISSYDPQLRRYDFIGWSTTENGTVEYQPEETITLTDDTTLYAQYKSRIFQTQANAPILGTGMKAVYWTNDNGGGETTAASFTSSMYNYTMGNGLTDSKGTKWANAVTLDSNNKIDAYWVWIPRYAYRIVYYQDANRRRRSDVKTKYGDTEVVFLSGTSNTSYIDGSGTTKAINDSSGYTYKYRNASNNWVTLNSSNDWKVQPAFQKMTTTESNNNNPLGKWDSELKGIWVGKYQASQEMSTNNGSTWTNVNTSSASTGNRLTTNAGNSSSTKYRVAVKPSAISWRYVTQSNMYLNASTMKSSLNSHEMKNSEWGAAAYLAYSPYGRNGEELGVNQCSGYYTGAGPGQGSSKINNSNYAYNSSTFKSTYAWNTTQGKLASTTGNIYGIYDMSGLSNEYVASYFSNGNSSLTTNGANLVNSTVKRNKQVYKSSVSNGNSSPSPEYNLIGTNGIYGDAVYETSTAATGANCWCGDYAYTPWNSSCFFRRGGHLYDGSLCGLFYFSDANGTADMYGAFRPVLAFN